MKKPMTNSPHSNSSQSVVFDSLADPVKRWIWRKNWKSLHDIQEKAIPIVLDGESDIIIAAPTAGGKTEAAFLPLISAVLDSPGKGGFDLVYVSPLRALINDQFDRLDDLCKNVEIPVHPWHGDISRSVKNRANKTPRGILLITPESLEAIFVLRGMDVPRLFESARAIVVDELHAFLNNERGIQLRSLLTRLELAVGHRVRRIGLSATLGEMELARKYLRPEDNESVVLLKEESVGAELKVQLRGYLDTICDMDDQKQTSKKEVASHVYTVLRGKRNLVFAGSRQNVEWYADALRGISSKYRVPLEFYPHHANLSREHRNDLEKTLKTQAAATAICTSTLELGIDIGDISCVAQIGPPFTVSSLRQRLGRSGRREGQAAVLRMYNIETEVSSDSHPIDRIHLDLIRSIAMIQLLIEGWCEPPSKQSLHLSTLTHQILSIIAERGGSYANSLYSTLCKSGPFRNISSELFIELLRHMGKPETSLIEQLSDGTLLLGSKGERLVNHYSFFAVFNTPDEYRIVNNGKTLGSIPITHVLVADMTIVFSGRRWRIIEVHDKEKVIQVVADRTGKPPRFTGNAGLIHDGVISKMKEVYIGSEVPTYLDNKAKKLLTEARDEYERLGLVRNPLFSMGKRRCIVATGVGTVKNSTLALALKANGYKVESYDGFLEVSHEESIEDLVPTISRLTTSTSISTSEILSEKSNLITEKYHCYLSDQLLVKDVESSRIELRALPSLAEMLLEQIQKGDSPVELVHTN